MRELTATAANSSEVMVCATVEVSRRMDPIGTGFLKAIPSRERKRSGARVNRYALVYPIYQTHLVGLVKRARGKYNYIPHMLV